MLIYCQHLSENTAGLIYPNAIFSVPLDDRRVPGFEVHSVQRILQDVLDFIPLPPLLEPLSSRGARRWSRIGWDVFISQRRCARGWYRGIIVLIGVHLRCTWGRHVRWGVSVTAVIDYDDDLVCNLSGGQDKMQREFLMKMEG